MGWVIFCKKCGGVLGTGWCQACEDANQVLDGHFACVPPDIPADAQGYAVYCDYYDDAVDKNGLCTCQMGYTCPICEGENVKPDQSSPGFGVCPDCGAEDIYLPTRA